MLLTSYGENANWFRYSKYETFETEKGVYIIPSQKAERIIYNPSDLGDRLITDYLKFGKYLSEGLDGSDKINEALKLAKKYGLLGVLTFSQFRKYRRDSISSDWSINLAYDDGEFIGEKTFQEYINEFFLLPDRQPSFNFNEKNYSESRYDELEQDILQYERNYSERVGWIARKAHDLYNNFKSITNFKNTEVENLSNIEYMDKIFDCRYKIKNIDLSIYYDEIKGAYLNWEADNLLKMIDILYALKLMDKKTGLATCQYCKEPFFKRRKDMKYCSDECGNSFRVRKCKIISSGE